VDDKSMNRIMLSRYITKLDYQATLVEDGQQASKEAHSMRLPLDL
jgi:CheY-like chemotaxis protein